MMTIDRLESKLEKLIDQVRSITFQFHDSDLESEAEESKNEAIAALENFQELAGKDWEERPQGESSNSGDDDGGA